MNDVRDPFHGQNGRSSNPQDDRTIIRPSGFKPPPAAASRVAPRKRSGALRYVAWASVFLLLGLCGGGAFVLVKKGIVSISAPPDALQDLAEVAPKAGAPAQDAVTPSTPPGSAIGNQTRPAVAETDLDEPADPFFDMAASAVIPLAGDPVVLDRGDRRLQVPLIERALGGDFPMAEGDGAVQADKAYILDDVMLQKDGNLATRAPGSEADFRFASFGGTGDETAPAPAEEGVGAAAPSAASGLGHMTDANGTLNIFMSDRPVGQGPRRIDVAQLLPRASTLGAFLVENGFDKEAADKLGSFMKSEFSIDGLAVGDRVAARGIRLPNRIGQSGDHYLPVQVSVYGKRGYIGTAALSTARGERTYVAGADPWFGKTIGETATPAKTGAPVDPDRSHRLIDGLYATAVRNAVPTAIVGEAISYLAAMTDLQRPIRSGERFTLVFTAEPRDPKRGGGRVLFAGIGGGEGAALQCYVLKAPGNRGFTCVDEGGGVSVSGAMLVPVKGVLTSKFGNRVHPILKIGRLHAGVDWAAAPGTPIHAAFSGKIVFRDVRGGYGNSIEIDHRDGITSRYAHMQNFADAVVQGSTVEAGDLIGYVGTTGLSTGPHLHFEIRRKGEPIDPLAFEMAGGGEAPQSVASSDIRNYRALVERILSGR